jgi:hypothetical protein
MLLQWLVNVEPQRVYLYDFTNNRVMFDYAVDESIILGCQEIKGFLWRSIKDATTKEELLIKLELQIIFGI